MKSEMVERVREEFSQVKTLVIKVGSAQITDGQAGLNTAAMSKWCEQIRWARESGVRVVLVSSGAVASGMGTMKMARPTDVHQLQALAAIGQMGLVQTWERLGYEHDFQTAQLLLTHDDLSDRKRYLNARSSISALLDMGVVPVINENDAVTTDYTQFGDNDSLAALIANLIEADLLVILTDQQGLYNKNPREYDDAELVSSAVASDPVLMEMASSKGGALGKGGMATKIRAAEIANRSGCHTVIALGSNDNVIQRILQGEKLGTALASDQETMAARKRWIGGQMHKRGVVIVDDGAREALCSKGTSLLPVGVVSVEGDFQRGELVFIEDKQGRLIARGLVNYSAKDAQQLVGCPSHTIPEKIGFMIEEELVHRDNMVVH